ncbi:hypothetical protein [Thiogranum longum]|uniref:hypothetical protein n=1 Tax=Thiogranum longum TaxID=1537524 RepID=UPI001403DC0C|nr:hypothetical protein [Thiogranum longum]
MNTASPQAGINEESLLVQDIFLAKITPGHGCLYCSAQDGKQVLLAVNMMAVQVSGLHFAVGESLY